MTLNPLTPSAGRAGVTGAGWTDATPEASGPVPSSFTLIPVCRGCTGQRPVSRPSSISSSGQRVPILENPHPSQNVPVDHSIVYLEAGTVISNLLPRDVSGHATPNPDAWQMWLIRKRPNRPSSAPSKILSRISSGMPHPSSV